MPDRLSPSREQEIRDYALDHRYTARGICVVELLAELDAERATLAAIRATLSGKQTNDAAKVRDVWALLLGCHWSDVKVLLASAPAETEKT